MQRFREKEVRTKRFKPIRLGSLLWTFLLQTLHYHTDSKAVGHDTRTPRKAQQNQEKSDRTWGMPSALVLWNSQSSSHPHVQSAWHVMASRECCAMETLSTLQCLIVLQKSSHRFRCWEVQSVHDAAAVWVDSASIFLSYLETCPATSCIFCLLHDHCSICGSNPQASNMASQ